jgi:serine/threonine-protein kinase
VGQGQGDSNSAAGVREGDILAGKYRVERVLGVGGMGVVVAAHHIQLDEKVALKFLLPDALCNTEAVSRFAREARAAVKIKSEHVARISDVGTLPNGAPYMVMEYLDGGDLSAWLQQRGPMPLEQAVEFVLQACIAVADAHGLGIIHRDLKPANLFCVRRSDGQFVIKVLDFGISKLTDTGRAGSSEPPGVSVTKTNAVMGSPLYMSPEQVQSAKDVDARTDIWALGVILFELVTGSVPFPGESFGEVAVKIAAREHLSLRTYRPEAPPELEAVIAKCLAKDRNDRYGNVAELALALFPFAPKRSKATVERINGIIQAAGLSASALALPPSPKGPAEAEPPETVAPWSGLPGVSSSKRAVVWGLGIAAVLAGVGAVVLLRQAPAETHSMAAVASVPLPSVPAPVAAPDAGPPTTRADTPEPAAPPPAANPLPMSAQAPEETSHSRATQPVTPHVPHVVPTAAAHPPKTNCTPPFTLDDKGQKHFKPECYQ